jgi:hypothetical protein
MRSSDVFILGAITGALVIWLGGREIQAFVRERTRDARAKTADGIRAVETQTDKMLSSGEHSLRRAEELVHATKEHVSDVLRAGEVAIRPV